MHAELLNYIISYGATNNIMKYYNVRHRCPSCGKGNCPEIKKDTLDFTCPNCTTIQMIQDEYPPQLPIYFTGNWQVYVSILICYPFIGFFSRVGGGGLSGYLLASLSAGLIGGIVYAILPKRRPIIFRGVETILTADQAKILGREIIKPSMTKTEEVQPAQQMQGCIKVLLFFIGVVIFFIILKVLVDHFR